MIERVADGEERDEAPEEKSARAAQGGVRQENHRARLRLRRHALPAPHAGLRLPAADRHRPGGVLEGVQRHRAPRRRRRADLLHAPDVPEGQGGRRAHRPRRPRRARQARRAVPRRRGMVRRDRRLREAAQRDARHRPAPLRRLRRPHRDHRGHAHLQALPQRLRVGILVRRLRPAVPQARHHRHRQDAIPVPHQQGHRGSRPGHQRAHGRRASGPSRSAT